MPISLKERLRVYLMNHPEWLASGTLQRMVAAKTDYSPQNVGRRLREMAEAGTLEVEYRNNHAWYRYKEPTQPKVEEPVVTESLFKHEQKETREVDTTEA